MLKVKNCFRCGGDIYETGESEIDEATCLQCGCVQYSKAIKIDSDLDNTTAEKKHNQPRRKAV